MNNMQRLTSNCAGEVLSPISDTAAVSSSVYFFSVPCGRLSSLPPAFQHISGIRNESVPIQLAQCRFPGLAISNAKTVVYCPNEIYGSNFIKQHSETVMV